MKTQIKNKAERINITLDKQLLQKFRKFCKKEGMAVSKRIAVLIEKDLS